MSRAAVRMFDAVWNAVSDEDGQTPVSELFKDLPDEDMYPDYYEVTTHPICLRDIRRKLRHARRIRHRSRRGGSGTVSRWHRDVGKSSALPRRYKFADIMKDLRRLVANVKRYNMPHAPVYQDALALERVMRRAQRDIEDAGLMTASDEDSDDEKLYQETLRERRVLETMERESHQQLQLQQQRRRNTGPSLHRQPEGAWASQVSTDLCLLKDDPATLQRGCEAPLAFHCRRLDRKFPGSRLPPHPPGTVWHPLDDTNKEVFWRLFGRAAVPGPNEDHALGPDLPPIGSAVPAVAPSVGTSERPETVSDCAEAGPAYVQFLLRGSAVGAPRRAWMGPGYVAGPTLRKWHPLLDHSVLSVSAPAARKPSEQCDDDDDPRKGRRRRGGGRKDSVKAEESESVAAPSAVHTPSRPTRRPHRRTPRPQQSEQEREDGVRMAAPSDTTAGAPDAQSTVATPQFRMLRPATSTPKRRGETRGRSPPGAASPGSIALNGRVRPPSPASESRLSSSSSPSLPGSSSEAASSASSAASVASAEAGSASEEEVDGWGYPVSGNTAFWEKYQRGLLEGANEPVEQIQPEIGQSRTWISLRRGRQRHHGHHHLRGPRRGNRRWRRGGGEPDDDDDGDDDDEEEDRRMQGGSESAESGSEESRSSSSSSSSSVAEAEAEAETETDSSDGEDSTVDRSSETGYEEDSAEGGSAKGELRPSVAAGRRQLPPREARTPAKKAVRRLLAAAANIGDDEQEEEEEEEREENNDDEVEMEEEDPPSKDGLWVVCGGRGNWKGTWKVGVIWDEAVRCLCGCAEERPVSRWVQHCHDGRHRPMQSAKLMPRELVEQVPQGIGFLEMSRERKIRNPSSEVPKWLGANEPSFNVEDLIGLGEALMMRSSGASRKEVQRHALTPREYKQFDRDAWSRFADDPRKLGQFVQKHLWPSAPASTAAARATSQNGTAASGRVAQKRRNRAAGRSVSPPAKRPCSSAGGAPARKHRRSSATRKEHRWTESSEVDVWHDGRWWVGCIRAVASADTPPPPSASPAKKRTAARTPARPSRRSPVPATGGRSSSDLTTGRHVAQQDAGQRAFLVHFRGWAPKFDEWIGSQSSRLAPLHTYTSEDDHPARGPFHP